MNNSYLMLQQVVDEIPSIDGIVAYSLFQLPEDKFLRSGIYEEILLRGGELHFALEGLRITNNTEINRIENIWSVRQTLPSCPKRIVRL